MFPNSLRGLSLITPVDPSYQIIPRLTVTRVTVLGVTITRVTVLGVAVPRVTVHKVTVTRV